MTITNDPVDVVVAFDRGRIRPARFRWAGRTFDVKRVNLIHAFHAGRAKVFSFSVSDLPAGKAGDANFWKLEFNTAPLRGG